jgi:aminoglycoside/choline kinase family phosphotransferase
MINLDEKQAHEFLAKNNIKDCEIKKIAGDASFRSYYRIFFGEETNILMFAPPGYEDVRPFAKIDEFLVLNNFSAPKIFARDEELGFLLLEDLNDNTYGRVLATDDSQELELYEKACDCLLELHKLEAPKNLPLYNHALLFREAMLFIDWYIPSQKQEITLQEKAQFKFLWFQLLDQLSQFNGARNHLEKNSTSVLVLRDYHADNLMILPSREGHKQVGLLDFQDAVIGSKAYDLVSLLEDARRDVNSANRLKLFDYYLKKSSCDKAEFTRDYEILSLQRNIKIVGIFSRLSMRDGKNDYLKLLPRVLGFVKSRLESGNPIFAEMSQLLKKFI